MVSGGRCRNGAGMVSGRIQQLLRFRPARDDHPGPAAILHKAASRGHPEAQEHLSSCNLIESSRKRTVEIYRSLFYDIVLQ